MTWELISATPSPYARKVRIALQEKNLPFELKTEVPWDNTTQTPQYNPLEKLPVLIFNDGTPAVYESHFILEWLETKHPKPSLLPSMEEADDRLLVKQIEVVVDGICDALVLSFFENQRDEDKRSKPWTDRQMRKVEGGLRALNTWVEQRKGDYLIQNRLTYADIATCSVLGFMNVRWPQHNWKEQYPQMEKYFKTLDERPSFANTRPSPQKFSDPVV